MNNLSHFAASPINPIETRELLANGVSTMSGMVEERLPFTVRMVRNEQDLSKAIHIRHAAYSRHMPLFAQALKTPEEDDTEDSAVVLLAESKLDGSPLGTVRIQTNHFNRLNLEQSIELPNWLKEQSIAEVRRLAIAPGSSGRLVKMVLVKACFQYCEQNDIDWAVVAARPPLDHSYEKLLFSDILSGKTFIPLPRENNVPHRVLAFEIETGRERWTQAQHPLLNFFSNTYHPDIDISDSSAVDGTHLYAQGNRSISSEAH